MKKLAILLCFIVYLLAPLLLVQAEESYSHLYISVGDAMMKTKADDWTTVKSLVSDIHSDWEQVDEQNAEEAKNVKAAISEVDKALQQEDKEAMLAALANVSRSLMAFEKELNPVDEVALRDELHEALTPILADLKLAIEGKNAEFAGAQYKKFLSMWTRKEMIVREQSIAYYGKIETQTGFLRIALTQEEKDFTQMLSIYDALAKAIDEFVAGEELQVADEGYTLQTLVDLLIKADKTIDKGKPEEAVTILQEFLIVWPSVEGDVSTRNGNLYTKLESDIPLIAGKLSSANVDLKAQQAKLKEYQVAIELLQEKTSYSIWDVALILLREGIEALLIVTALIAFLRKANAYQYEKWIWLGALFGVAMSVAAAIFINMMFSAATAGANREVIEGVTGIVAVVMMLSVGIWLHQKSNIHAWNHFVQNQIGNALSTGSVVSMALVSFLSIFREGAETIIFYTGMAPSISLVKMLVGIGVATVILAVFAFLLMKYSTKIKINIFFKLATILIYFLAFKILGVSIHALQITNYISTSQIQSLPIVNVIGFYPTWETLVPQLVLLGVVFVIVLSVEIRKKSLQAKGI